MVQPSAKREGFATVPDTTWEDVGALEGVRQELSLAILVGGAWVGFEWGLDGHLECDAITAKEIVA